MSGRRAGGFDSADTYGVRGAGVNWQARFGMTLNEADLHFAVRREPVAKRVVFDVAYDLFSKGFTVEKASDTLQCRQIVPILGPLWSIRL